MEGQIVARLDLEELRYFREHELPEWFPRNPLHRRFLPNKKKEHWIKGTWTFDVQGTYNFVFAPPVESQPVAGYSKDSKEMTHDKDGKAFKPTQTANYSMPCWKNLVNNTGITVGCNNVFGQDNPTAFGGFGNITGYPGFIYDAVGRFVYFSLTKKF